MKQKIQKALTAVKRMLERNWSIWVILLVIAALWALVTFVGPIGTSFDDGIAGGLLAVLGSEGIRSALRSAKEHRQAQKASTDG